MERFLHRDHLLLGPGHRRSCGSPKMPFRNSDVDFNDVFGGPPSRSSMHDWRHGVGETVDSNVSRGRGGGEKETISSRDPRTFRSEKPVFGEESLSCRRRQTNEFYDDIFRGDESSSSTPKKPGWDPASRVLSPARPLPPLTEPFLISSLPPKLSLQGKLAKEIDFSASCTPNCSPQKNKAGDLNGLDSPVFSSSTSVSRLSAQVIPGEDGLRNDLRSLYRQSSLSKEFSFNINMSPKSTKVETNEQEGLWKKESMLSDNDSSSQFHFSIYKWASKGVPVAMLLQGRNSSRAKESGKDMNRGNEEPAPVSQDVESSSISENTLETNESCRMECEIKNNNSVITTKKKDRIDSSKSVKEVSSGISESKSITKLQSMILETPNNHVLPNVGKETRPCIGAPLDVYSSKSTVTEKLVSSKEVLKPGLKTLHCLLKDDSSRQGNANTVEQPRVKEGKARSTHTSVRDADVNEKENKGTGNGKILNLKKESNSSLQDSPADSEGKLVRNKVKGKVKEFVKIFNQEVSVKPINNAGSGVRERSVRKAEDEANDGTSRTTSRDMKEKLSNAMDDRKLTDTSIMDDQTMKDSAKPSLSLNSTAYKIGDASSERKDSLLSCDGSVPESFESGIGNAEEYPCADLHCQVEELSHEEEIQPQIGQNQEKIQDSDAWIKQWSSGKEGNIRSLLSTLQYVLWPESGWKPVPLVDIIEGNSVKRAYQRALLCLHPDKLQQKGAAPHQKYIAEKVFDLLQEAWTHISTH